MSYICIDWNICIYVYTHIHMHIQLHIHMHIYFFSGSRSWLYGKKDLLFNVYTCFPFLLLLVCVCVHSCVRVFSCMWVSARVYVYMPCMCVDRAGVDAGCLPLSFHSLFLWPGLSAEPAAQTPLDCLAGELQGPSHLCSPIRRWAHTFMPSSLCKCWRSELKSFCSHIKHPNH